MAPKIVRVGFLSKPSEIVLLASAFISLNVLILAFFEETLITKLNVDSSNNENIMKKEIQHEDEEIEQVITIEEDGRFGNLLMETATLLLVGQRVNKRVQLLPGVDKKLRNYFSSLPAQTIDHTKVTEKKKTIILLWRQGDHFIFQHCVCHYCSECLCPKCNKWRKIPSWTYLSQPDQFDNETYLMLKWFNSELVMRHIGEARDVLRPLLRQDVIDTVQDYFSSLAETRGTLTYINIHVRRTDYISFIAERYKGHQVNENYFNYCIEEFLTEYPNSIFLVTSDDIAWCREHLKHERIVFPHISSPADPVVTDFILMTQVNHSIYDYGSFAFWGAVLAGGETLVAEGYSSKQHPMLTAIKKHPPPGWRTVDVSQL